MVSWGTRAARDQGDTTPPRLFKSYPVEVVQAMDQKKGPLWYRLKPVPEGAFFFGLGLCDLGEQGLGKLLLLLCRHLLRLVLDGALVDDLVPVVERLHAE